MKNIETSSDTGKQQRRSFKKTAFGSLLALLIAVNIFGAGWLVGKGDISFGGDQPHSANKTLPENLNYATVEEVYDTLKKGFDGPIEAERLLEGLKRGLVEAADDPYTEFFNASEAKEFNDALSGTFTGIGAELGTNEDDQILVVSPLAGFPAEKAGLLPQDIIIAIDDESTDGLSVAAAVRKIRGEEGTAVSLTILRAGGEPFDVKITRAKIDVPSASSKLENGFGYLKINQFSDDTQSLAQAAAAEFKKQKVRGVVLDLRGNPGGYLSGAVQLSSLWLEEGATVVSERRAGRVISTEKASGPSPFKGMPTVVLIDAGSASASEITAGALRDHKAATLVGTKTFGKGSVQRVDKLSGGEELKLTIARWYTPSSKNIDKEGIKPDIEVQITNEQRKAGADPQKDKAYELLNQKIGSAN